MVKHDESLFHQHVMCDYVDGKPVVCYTFKSAVMCTVNDKIYMI